MPAGQRSTVAVYLLKHPYQQTLLKDRIQSITLRRTSMDWLFTPVVCWYAHMDSPIIKAEKHITIMKKFILYRWSY